MMVFCEKKLSNVFTFTLSVVLEWHPGTKGQNLLPSSGTKKHTY